MAIKLNAAYSKKLGLPNYSSHSFSASVEVELTDPGNIAAETARLYATLQTSVDNEIRQVGYLPGHDEIHPNQPFPSGNGHHNGNHNGSSCAMTPHPANGATGHPNGGNGGNGNHAHDPDAWRCSDKQRDLINRLITENGLDRAQIEALSQDRFGCGLTALNKLQASGIIDELLESCGRNNGNGKSNGSGNGRSRQQPVGNGGAQG
ncbi:MAG: hypothetical protein KDM81_16085 [Verrucomicrobiae bacterium]|nr:hypothetical protein [Verrucomicrobiae bacterium]